jgi:hypothetical protein
MLRRGGRHVDRHRFPGNVIYLDHRDRCRAARKKGMSGFGKLIERHNRVESKAKFDQCREQLAPVFASLHTGILLEHRVRVET